MIRYFVRCRVMNNHPIICVTSLAGLKRVIQIFVDFCERNLPEWAEISYEPMDSANYW
jgi:hypothetical protein